MSESEQRLDRHKFDALVHYIIAYCPETAKLGSVKLHKILWKTDTSFYKQHKKPITGASYRKRKFGPATDELLRARDRLTRAAKIRYWRDEGFAPDRAKDVYRSVSRPDLSVLTDEERRTVDYWMKEICLGYTAEGISDETHGFAWELAKDGEQLPLYSVFVDELPEEPDEESSKWAKDEAKRLGLSEF